jgi:serine/threonine protein kinase
MLDWIRRGGSTDIKVLQKIGVTLFKALHAMHQAGFVHADIKLENILVTAELDADNVKRPAQVRLADFGLTLTKDEAPALRGALYGTLNMLSPEQLFRTQFSTSEKVDIWAAGAVLFCMAVHRALIPVKDAKDDIDIVPWYIFEVLGKEQLPQEQLELYQMLATREEKKEQAMNPNSWKMRRIRQLIGELEEQLQYVEKHGFGPPRQAGEQTATDRFLSRYIDYIDMPSLKRTELRDLLCRIFVFNPNLRPSAFEVLQHPFFLDAPDNEEAVKAYIDRKNREKLARDQKVSEAAKEVLRNLKPVHTERRKPKSDGRQTTMGQNSVAKNKQRFRTET